MRAAALAFALLLAAVPRPGLAQQETGDALDMGAPAGIVRSPVLTLDADRLFSESRFGQRIAADIQAETEALAAENRRIADELEAEEQALTERRPQMEPEAFRAAAQEFDTRVQAIRREQDAKERDIGQRVQRAQESFLGAVRPILGDIMFEAGAAVILDRRTVVLGLGSVDVTDAAVSRIDAEMGEGPGLRALEQSAEEGLPRE